MESQMPKNKKTKEPLTTAQQLGSIIKSSRQIMRKDKGLSGDLDRLPILTWVMFLKFLDDLEQLRETEAVLEGKAFQSAIEPPYRWRDWAAIEGGITGDELIAFINQERAILPDGKEGQGLITYLRKLQGANGGDRRDVIATVFSGLQNRMLSGYLLRDVIEKVNGIHFNSSEEMHTLSHLYETMIREMRDAAGDSGEFYTPRPVVKFMVKVTNPKLGETLLDPACGTGGFLVEAMSHLEKQCQTVEQRELLQKKTLFGGEAKPLPYLLVQMNLLLHGLEYPRIDSENSLRFQLREIGDKDRVDVILTNPPFGGEEEKGILGNFPEDLQTAETALLFLQLIMRKLKRPGQGSEKGGRAAVIVPNGTLYASGVASRIRKLLLEDFNLHTVVRLPKGIFEPYADIPTNILFFDRSGRTENVWFYEHPLPPHRAKLSAPSYSLSDPLLYEEFLPLIDWWEDRKTNDHAWCISANSLAELDYNLDQKNPNVGILKRIDIKSFHAELRDYSKYLNTSLKMLGDSLIQLDDLITSVDSEPNNEGKLGDLCDLVKGAFPTKKTPPGEYRFVVTAADRRTANNFQLDTEAVCVPMVSSTGHGHAAIHRIHYAEGKFALANIMAAITPKHDTSLLTKYLYYYLWRYKEEKLVKLMAGTANTSLTLDKLKSVEIAYPDIEAQETLIEALDRLFALVKELSNATESISKLQQDATLCILTNVFSRI
jgi:type I restriction enzyme M protein